MSQDHFDDGGIELGMTGAGDRLVEGMTAAGGKGMAGAPEERGMQAIEMVQAVTPPPPPPAPSDAAVSARPNSDAPSS